MDAQIRAGQWRYRKLPVEIEAFHFAGGKESAGEAFAFMDCPKAFWLDNGGIAIPTLEGTMIARPGDWIIRGVRGELYPCKPDIFAATYEKCEPEDPIHAR